MLFSKKKNMMTLKSVPTAVSKEIGALMKVIRGIPMSGSSAHLTLSKVYLTHGINNQVNRFLTASLKANKVLDVVGSDSRYLYERLVPDDGVTAELCGAVLKDFKSRTKHLLVANNFYAVITSDVVSAEAAVIMTVLSDMLKDMTLTGKYVSSKSFSKMCTTAGVNYIAVTHLPGFLLNEGVLVKKGTHSVPVDNLSLVELIKVLFKFHEQPAFSNMTILTLRKLYSVLGKSCGPLSKMKQKTVKVEEDAMLPVVPTDCDTGSHEEYDLPESEANKAKAAWEEAILKAQEEQKKADEERERKEQVLRDRQQEEDLRKRNEAILDKLRRPDKYAKLSSYLSKVRRLPRPCLAPGSDAWWFGDGLTLRYGVIQSASLEEKKSESGLVVLTPHYVVVTCTAPFESVTVDCDVYPSREEMLDAMDAKLSALR